MAAVAAEMFERVFGDWRQAAADEFRLIAVAAAAGVAAAAALGMLYAAVFVYVMHRSSAIEACLVVGGLCFAAALVLVAAYVAIRRKMRAAAAARAAQRSLLSDPLVLTTGLQIVQAIGLKRAVTLLALIGGGMVLASRFAAPRIREHI